ncbi:hypothetical protein FA95DRAFT_1580220 [Auriscalpium vulgare]|uniref:Uncharacterized protein n=1 Tax=Auriscalpium vulgare TaxID=40419 RepID=A0ACB8S8C7_9AGAM|nr:hypothetical protein FA95DRAFT_1580220 [Auriscalpium vulgare]
MATETQTAPELTVLHRVASIPVISDSLSAVHSSLSSNQYTRSPYSSAQALSTSALRYTEPLAQRFAPLIVTADSYGNKAVDFVASRYPYPFTTPTNDIVNDIKERSAHAQGVATKTIDERVRSPAYAAAEGIDQRFAPLVDYFAAAVSKLHGAAGQNGTTQEPASPGADAKYQYQRAFALGQDLKDTVYVYSSEQVKQLQAQNALVQRATATAQSISQLASSSVTATQTRAAQLSDTMVQELRHIQASTAQLPAHLQASFKPVQEGISGTVTDLTAVLNSDAPRGEKLEKLKATVTARVQPVLNAAATRVQELLATVTTRAEATKENVANGSSAEH